MNSTDLTSTKLSPSNASVAHPDDEQFEFTWNEILYDGGLATWTPRSSFRWLTISICLIGVLGNVLAVCTLLRRRMRTLSTYTYLAALCVSNTVTLVSVIIFEVDLLVEPNQFNCFAVSFAKALASSTLALSTWITICFTVDRYVMICYPFTGETMCTRRHALYVLFACLFSSLAYLIPQLLAQKCHPIDQYHYNFSHTADRDPFLNHTVVQLPVFWVAGLSKLGKSLAYRISVTLFVNCFLVRILPFVVIFKLNLRLIQTLAHTKRVHRQLNPYEEKRHDVTYMLVIVISTYLICVMPSIPFVAFFAYDPHRYVDTTFHYRAFHYLDEFAKCLLIFNSASQCYLYIFFGKRFRQELTRLLCCLCVQYLYMPIPEMNTNTDGEILTPTGWNTNEAFELVLQGKWSLDQRQDSIAGLEFTFHYPRRWSRFTSSSRTPTTRSDSVYSNDQIHLGLLKRLKDRVEQLFARFK